MTGSLHKIRWRRPLIACAAVSDGCRSRPEPRAHPTCPVLGGPDVAPGQVVCGIGHL
jgi:hypothetical protein